MSTIATTPTATTPAPAVPGRLRSWGRGLAVLAVLSAAAAGLTWLFGALVKDTLGRDYICFWAAGELLTSGRDLYDPALQAQLQRTVGWDREAMGYGLWDFLPMFYPPWMVAPVVPLLPLGFAAGRVAWVALGFLALLLAGHLSRNPGGGLRAWVGPAAVALFFPSALAASQGQTTPFVVLLLALTGWLLRGGHDRAAGVALAWLTVKPQLAVLPLAGLLLWSVRRRRWGLVQGFAVMLAVLLAASTAVQPGWPQSWLAGLRHSPMPTDQYPEVGTCWLTVLRTLGLQGWALWGAYALAALPALAAVAWVAWGCRGLPDPTGRVGQECRSADAVLAAGCLAAFFCAPYARMYDYAILAVPLLALGRVRLLAVVVVLSWVHLLLLPHLTASTFLPGRQLKMYTSFFIPVLVAVGLIGWGCRPAAGVPVTDRRPCAAG
jgi:hypothetical protein